MNIILTPETIMESKEPYIFVDVRTKYKDYPDGREAYNNSHIPNAVFLDMKRDLTGDTTFLPNIEELSVTLGSLGIDETKSLVLYDQGNQRAAAKAWYVFHYLGHQKVYIMQGGFPAWIEAGGKVNKTIPTHPSVIYTTNLRIETETNIQQMKSKLKKKSAVLLDARAPERYEGKIEPKYHKSGHIPGAMNYHAKDVFETTGIWKNKQELSKHFARLNKDEEVVVSCGSGNSACMDLVALKEAGFEHVSLFAGGFSEWIADDMNEVATGKEEDQHEK